MKIVDRATFLALPSGTIFAKYAPCYFEELSVKGDSLETDFIYQGLVTPNFTTANDSGEWGEALQWIEEGNPSPPLDFDMMGRDGCFDDKQLFAVWEDDDVEVLILRLIKARLEVNGPSEAASPENEPF
ncbi:MAG: hypothetical protein V4696_01550 [Pseudomonadota bacterium]